MAAHLQRLLRAGGDRGADFRSDLEGLRGVAVVLVLLYHAQLPGFPGGFAGVDVFFVLSGFLITGILLRERTRTGGVSLPAFYARRARRLLPAAMLVLLATVLLSALLLPPMRMPDIAADAVAAAFYASNVRFGLQATDYLSANLAPSPVLHYWSLAVEEQFYLCWPAIVLAVTWRARPGSAALRIGLAAAAIGLLSFAASMWLTYANPPWAYFSPLSRAWELGIGAVLAVMAGRLTLPRRGAIAAGWIGLAAVIASGVLLNEQTPFPGTAALLPALGAALVIAAGAGAEAPGGASAGRLLGLAPMRYLGRISYSVYLWHWPLLTLPVAAGAALGLPARLLLVGVAIALAALTYALLEDPLRRGVAVGTRPLRNLVAAGGVSAIVAASALNLGASATAAMSMGVNDLAADQARVQLVVAHAQSATADGALLASLPATPDSPVPPALAPPLASIRSTLPAAYRNGCVVDWAVTDSPWCVFGDPHGSKTVVLFGDSHAAHWQPPLAKIALARHWRLIQLAKAACSPGLVVQPYNGQNRPYNECGLWRKRMLVRIAGLHPDLVIVAERARQTILGPNGSPLADDDAARAFGAGLATTLRELKSMASGVVLLIDTPTSQFDVPLCLSAHPNSILSCSTPIRQAEPANWKAAQIGAASQAGVPYLDPTVWVCPTNPCPPVISHVIVFRDSQHLTPPFALALTSTLARALPDPSPATG